EEQTMLHHLASCRQCSEMFERLTGLERELANLPKVTPPYSIVDAMLPQLDRLAAEAKAKETADRTAVGRPGRPEHTAARRIEDRAQRRRPAPGLWKWAGGAAAAAAVFAVVLFVADGMPVRHAEDAVR